ncbi:hypothetical protein WJX73_003231 [Symbiochloris irregularis]|uniref:holo-[acyl-carrier-protein] synthase n=1 Tax=Symbiochloris irregularis TaxID=706552 RepID=A0AAW1P6T3_9CHLO
MRVNVAPGKTEMMIFGVSDERRIALKAANSFHLGGQPVRYTHQYTYLGCLLHEKTYFQPDFAKRKSQMFVKTLALRRALDHLNAARSLSLGFRLYDVQVRPSALYGSCVWGTRGRTAQPIWPGFSQQLPAPALISVLCVRAGATSRPSNQHLRQGLNSGEVHVWWLDPNKATQPGLLDRYKALLPRDEQLFVAEGGSAAVQKERLLTRVLVRCTLARYFPFPVLPVELQFSKNRHGKPGLQKPFRLDDIDLQFNITHTPHLIGCAVSAQSLIGLDIELAFRKCRPARAFKKYLTSAEIAACEAHKGVMLTEKAPRVA